MGCGERKRDLPGSREGQPAGAPGDDDGLSASYCKPAMVAGIHFWQWLFTRLFTGNFYLLQPAFPFGREQEPAAKFRRAHDFQHRSSAAAPDGCCRVIETSIEPGLRLAVLMPGQYTKSIAGPIHFLSYLARLLPTVVQSSAAIQACASSPPVLGFEASMSAGSRVGK